MACPFRALTLLLPNRGDLYALSFLLYPRFSGGWFFSFDSMCGIVKLHPARGRKLHVQVVNAHLFHYNLSPQGDGNLNVSPGSTSSTYCNLSPQGDGNQNGLSERIRTRIAIYPREGAKTHFRYCSHLRNWQFQFLPIRGRKSFTANGTIMLNVQLQFIPVRGRKLCLCAVGVRCVAL